MIKLHKAFAVACAATVLSAAPALAHEHRSAGGHELTVGWRTEPTYASFPNGVQVIVDGSARDVNLQAVVIFGTRTGTQKTAAMDLEPSDENPGEYDADIIPTRPGTYTFHVSGSIAGEKVDQFFTSGPKTFDDVKEPQAAEFPVKDPTTGQLARRVAKADSEVSGAKSRANVGFVLAIVALGLSVAALSRRRR